MQKFCGKCGTPMEGMTHCPSCREPAENISVSSGNLEIESNTNHGNKRNYKVYIIMGICLVLLITITMYIWKSKPNNSNKKMSKNPTDIEETTTKIVKSPTISNSNDRQEESPLKSASYEDFVGNWLAKNGNKQFVFWIQEIGGRYVGSDDSMVIEFDELRGQRIKGTVTDGMNKGASATIDLSSDKQQLTFNIEPSGKNPLSYIAIRDNTLGKGTVSQEDIKELEIEVVNAFKSNNPSLDVAVEMLGNALYEYYVTEGNRDFIEAQKYFKEFLLDVKNEGLGLSMDYINQAIEPSKMKP